MMQVIFICVLLAASPAGRSPQAAVRAAPAKIAPMASRRSICPVEGFAGCIFGSMPVVRQEHFVYDQSMSVERHPDEAVSRIAAAIGEAARARLLECLPA